MKNNMNILLVSTSSWAGMGPYASEIINSFYLDRNVYYFVVEDERHFFSKNILSDNGRILYKTNSKLNKLTALFWPPCSIVKALKAYCKEKHIDVIHFLTSEVPYSKTIISLSHSYKVFFTVHDLHPHEAKKVFYKQFRHKMMYRNLAKTRQGVSNIITNSTSQEEELKEMFPMKNIYFHDFPSLINKAITNGNLKPVELNGIENYVLFFGRIEQYKGVELVYEAFVNDPLLQKNTLVIAGSGEVYFPIQKYENIILINRYIKDEEIAWLFNHAKLTVYPYISATQSGVLSVSCYFGKPIIASDVPFFRSVTKNKLGINFKAGDIADLTNKLKQMLVSDLSAISIREKEYYMSNYSKESIRQSLLEIYNR